MPFPDDEEQEHLDRLLRTFYTVPRVGQDRLSDGGGPFGFDITTALQVDHLIRLYDCDGIVETGCFLGDTTAYLARQYPTLPVRTCDIEPQHAAFTGHRLAAFDNATVRVGDSATLLPDLLHGLERPLIYLDAHWNAHWPLQEELATIQRGLVAVDDFDIGHDRFGSDIYDGVRCGPVLVHDALPDLDELYVGNPYASYPFPCQQVGRRSGTAFLTRELRADPLIASSMFVRVPLRPIVMPAWEVFDPRDPFPRKTGAGSGGRR